MAASNGPRPAPARPARSSALVVHRARAAQSARPCRRSPRPRAGAIAWRARSAHAASISARSASRGRRRNGARVVVLHVGIEQPEGLEQARRRRHDHSVDPEGRPCRRRTAARCRRRRAGRIRAGRGPLGRYRLDGADHVEAAISCAVEAAFSMADPAARRSWLRNARRAFGGVELQGAADQMRRVQVTQDDVGVRDGRHLAAGVVARRGPARLRALSGPTCKAPPVSIQMCEAAGPDLRQVDGGNALSCVTGPGQRAAIRP